MLWGRIFNDIPTGTQHYERKKPQKINKKKKNKNKNKKQNKNKLTKTTTETMIEKQLRLHTGPPK